VVAMVGDTVKQTRCATCETEHEYKHAKVPRQRRKADTPALYAQVLASGPKRVAHEHPQDADAPTGVETDQTDDAIADELVADADLVASAPADQTSPASALSSPIERHDDDSAQDDAADDDGDDDRDRDDGEGPVHRPLIRASLPKHEGQAPPSRPIPEFTIRQPAGRQNRFRPRGASGGGGGQFHGGNRSNGGGNGNVSGGGRPSQGGGGMRSSGGRPPQGGGGGGMSRRQGPPGRRRSK
jgi:hypothetical protein